mgnify:CR=1 FL=1|jgi:hypothetical protein
MTNLTRSWRFSLTSLCLAATVFFAAQNSQAAPVLDFTGGTAGSAQGISTDSTVGWMFDVHSAINVTSLGLWDEGANGLIDDHQVGLWAGDGTLLASTTVTNSSTTVSSTSADGIWLFEDITTVTLDVGRYAIAAVYIDDDDFIRTNTTISTIGEISYFEAATFVGGLVFPNRLKGDIGGYLGPNLRGEAVESTPAIPEPMTLAILGAGLAGLGFARRRKTPLQG